MFLATKYAGWTTTGKVALVSFLGHRFFYIPAATPYLLARGLDLAQVNGLQAMSLFTQVVLEVPTGVVADRIGRRRTVILAAGAQVLSELIFLLARDDPTFVISVVISGAGYALALGSRDALVFDSLPAGDRLKQAGAVWDRVDATFQEHQRIIEALRVRDAQAAEQTAHAHILPNQRAVIDALIASPGLRSINLVTI